jgi:hypothetical protein
MTIFQQNEIEKRIDILEDDISDIDQIILRILLKNLAFYECYYRLN